MTALPPSLAGQWRALSSENRLQRWKASQSFATLSTGSTGVRGWTLWCWKHQNWVLLENVWYWAQQGVSPSGTECWKQGKMKEWQVVLCVLFLIREKQFRRLQKCVSPAQLRIGLFRSSCENSDLTLWLFIPAFSSNSSVSRTHLTRKPLTEGLSVSVKWGGNSKENMNLFF